MNEDLRRGALWIGQNGSVMAQAMCVRSGNRNGHLERSGFAAEDGGIWPTEQTIDHRSVPLCPAQRLDDHPTSATGFQLLDHGFCRVNRDFSSNPSAPQNDPQTS
ncbi:hypothetical protein CLAIMM_02641, partial [Cladophialophora immunda]